jgi:hypothetical protein
VNWSAAEYAGTEGSGAPGGPLLRLLRHQRCEQRPASVDRRLNADGARFEHRSRPEACFSALVRVDDELVEVLVVSPERAQVLLESEPQLAGDRSMVAAGHDLEPIAGLGGKANGDRHCVGCVHGEYS